jgi:allantoate deiminase/N-carbamoyl-L-amino-acid hydrolase
MTAPATTPAAPPAAYLHLGQKLLSQADTLRAYSDEADCYTRTYLSAAHRQTAAQLKTWMMEAGMSVREDAVGNVIGRLENGNDNAPTLVTGSHFDTVRNAGRYDGVLGVILPIAVARKMHDEHRTLPFVLEVVGFADEEGVRYATSFLGSSAYIGDFNLSLLDRRDEQGIALRDAARDAGLDIDALETDQRNFANVSGYVEVHIEQGPVLLNEGYPLGVVTAIAGASRYLVTVTGEAGHAGTVPMPGRRDALAAAAEMALAVEAVAAAKPQVLVATVGKFHLDHPAANVIPGKVEFSIDLRSGDDAARRAAETELIGRLKAISARRNVDASLEPYHDSRAVPCDPALMDKMESAIAACGLPVRRLPSGAGHDAMTVAEVTKVAMLFVRCGAGGISHNPKETLTAEDAGFAVQAFEQFLLAF